MTQGDENDALLDALGALPAHDVRPEVRDETAARAAAILGREASPSRRIARLYRAIELPMLAVAAAFYLAWSFATVANVHREASRELAPTLAASAGATAAYTAAHADERISPPGPLLDRDRGVRPRSRSGA